MPTKSSYTFREDTHAMGWFRRLRERTAFKVGVGLGTILISAVISHYVTLATGKMRKLTYYVHPARATIVKAGEVSDLDVYYRGERVEWDVSAVQVQLWNQGRVDHAPRAALTERPARLDRSERFGMRHMAHQRSVDKGRRYEPKTKNSERHTV